MKAIYRLRGRVTEITKPHEVIVKKICVSFFLDGAQFKIRHSCYELYVLVENPFPRLSPW